MDYLIKKTSRKLEINEKIVEKVVRFQWRNAHDIVHTKNKIEITGIGYFYASKAKMQVKLLKLDKIKRTLAEWMIEKPEEIDRWNMYTQNADEKIADILKRLQAYESRLEGTSSGSIQQSDGAAVDKGIS